MEEHVSGRDRLHRKRSEAVTFLLCCFKVRESVHEPGCTRTDCTSLVEHQPDSHKEAWAGRSWGSTSMGCTRWLVSAYLRLAVDLRR